MERLLTRADLAVILGLKPITVRCMERQGRLPKGIRLGHRTLRWRAADIEAWLAGLAG
jgi:predicted DNA-binding transcriptional regulator AlpA